jgi:hypothetical protein
MSGKKPTTKQKIPKQRKQAQALEMLQAALAKCQEVGIVVHYGNNKGDFVAIFEDVEIKKGNIMRCGKQ